MSWDKQDLERTRHDLISMMIAVPLLLRFTSADWPWWAALLAASPLAIFIFDEHWAEEYPLYEKVRDWAKMVCSKVYDKLESFELSLNLRASRRGGATLTGTLFMIPTFTYIALCMFLFMVSGMEFFFGDWLLGAESGYGSPFAWDEQDRGSWIWHMQKER